MSFTDLDAYDRWHDEAVAREARRWALVDQLDAYADQRDAEAVARAVHETPCAGCEMQPAEVDDDLCCDCRTSHEDGLAEQRAWADAWV